MTGKERVMATFEGREFDRVPIYCAGLSGRIASHVLGREAFVGHGMQRYRESVARWEGWLDEFEERTRDDVLEVSEKLDLDLVRPVYWRYPHDPIERINEYTFMYGDEDAYWWVMRFDPETELYQECDRAPLEEPTIENVIRMTEQSEEAAENSPGPTPDSFPDLQAAIEYYGDRRAIPGSGTGVSIPRERHWLEAMITHTDVVRRYLVARARINCKTIPVMAGMGLKILFGGGDFAGKNGPLYGPKQFHECMLPALQIVSECCHEHDTWHFFASDGNLWPVAEDLFGNSGVDGFYEIDIRCEMTLERVRDAFPHLRLCGGIASETLHQGTVEDVKAEARAALEVARRRGQIVVGVSNQVVPATPLENFDAMMETLHEQP
ncbi:MAG: uroporphyrinogen decarboxylase family protein [Armatimonadota bacterium]